MKTKMTKVICFLLAAVMMLAVFQDCSAKAYDVSGEERIKELQEMYFTSYPGILIADGINAFFVDPQWRYEASEDCVVMKGIAMLNGEDAWFELFFHGTSETSFDLDVVKITMMETLEEVYLNEDEIIDMLDVIFGSLQENAETPEETQPAQPGQSYCSYCGGSGICTKCAVGTCDQCFGEGTEYCSRCYGGGECQTCYGTGGEYRYVFGKDDLEWRKCYSCNGRGTCGLCSGQGTKTCTLCSGRGTCNSCRGSENCTYCNGTGRS